MISVTLEGYKPSPRFDGTPWTSYRVQEALAKAGPWTDIETGALSPLDSDPTNPAVRNFTVDTDTIDGWYRVVFVDAGTNEEYTIPRWNHDSPNLVYLPTVDQVARKTMSRCRDKFGNQKGTFDQTTTPTDEQVEDIIFDVVTDVADVIGDSVPDELIDDAQQVVALKAAMRIETDFFPEQIRATRSPYPQLEAEYETQLGRLQRAIILYGEGDVVVDAGPSLSASGGFPDASTDWLTRRM